jgi:hypothetical protein
MSMPPANLRASLAHVLWIGGAPDAGKSSVADRLGAQYHLHVIHLDRIERDHIARHDPIRHPAIAQWIALSLDECWVHRSGEEIAQHTIRMRAERDPMLLDDLLALPRTPMILVEGPWLFPDFVAPLLSSPRQAIWLEPTPEFKRASAARRNKPSSRLKSSDPERFAQHWFARDMRIAAHVRRQVEEQGLTVVVVDGSRSVEEMVRVVEGHFAPVLAERNREDVP